MKRIYLQLFLGSFILITGCQTREQENTDQIQEEIPIIIHENEKSIYLQGANMPFAVQKEHAAPDQEEDYTAISPESLCPFTVDVYPEVLYVGDPLYIRMNFNNSTKADTYAYARPFNSTHIDTKIIEYYFKEQYPMQFIPWGIADVFFDGGSTHVWQKVKPGEKGLTQYMPLGFPGVVYKNAGSGFHHVRFDKKRWDEIRHMPPHITDDSAGMAPVGTVTVGQLVAIFTNGGYYFIPEDTSNFGIPPKPIILLYYLT